jgi:hypothetical protein
MVVIPNLKLGVSNYARVCIQLGVAVLGAQLFVTEFVCGQLSQASHKLELRNTSNQPILSM